MLEGKDGAVHASVWTVHRVHTYLYLGNTLFQSRTLKSFLLVHFHRILVHTVSPKRWIYRCY